MTASLANTPKESFISPPKLDVTNRNDFIQKHLNQVISIFRIPIEHAFAHLQRFKLLAGIYRGDHAIYDDTFLTISGLHNFRTMDSLTW